MGSTHRLGIVGLGVISKTYLDNLELAEDVEVTAVADLHRSRAESVASRYPGVRAMSVSDLMASDDVEAVLNLTIPAAHAEVSLAAVRGGKSVYSEKPLAATLEDAQTLLAEARKAGLGVGCAPDTVLGTGVQSARQFIESGEIGMPIAATAVMATPGHEFWHPNPDFYYNSGGGPLLDMGPYYISALVHLLGPVKSVVGMSSALRGDRVIGSGPRLGERIPVSVASHVTGSLEHESGAISTITMSFDSVATMAPPIEVHGERGSIAVPDPNHFHGLNQIRLIGDQSWTELQPTAGFQDGDRGLGLLDLLRGKRDAPLLASGELALHVLEVMLRLLDSTETGSRSAVESTVCLGPLVPLSHGFASESALLGSRARQ